MIVPYAKRSGVEQSISDCTEWHSHPEDAESRSSLIDGQFRPCHADVVKYFV
jgi:hypothetical protein